MNRFHTFRSQYKVEASLFANRLIDQTVLMIFVPLNCSYVVLNEGNHRGNVSKIFQIKLSIFPDRLRVDTYGIFPTFPDRELGLSGEDMYVS